MLWVCSSVYASAGEKHAMQGTTGTATLALTQAQMYVQILCPGLGCSGETPPCLPRGGVQELVRTHFPDSPSFILKT